MYAKWIPSIEIALLCTGLWNYSLPGPEGRDLHKFDYISEQVYCSSPPILSMSLLGGNLSVFENVFVHNDVVVKIRGAMTRLGKFKNGSPIDFVQDSRPRSRLWGGGGGEQGDNYPPPP